MKIPFGKIIGILFFVIISARAFAQQTLQDTNEIQTAAPDIWRDGIGSGFNSGTYAFGALAGAGIGTRVFGTTDRHDLALADVNAAWILPESFRQSRLPGNFELRGELFAGGQFTPASHYITGMTLMSRYDFATGSRWVPFLDAGAGLSGTDIGRPDLGELFNFNLQWGFGTYYFIRKNLALSAEYRWLHFSDAGITHLNHGTNTQMMEGGITWFF